MYITLFSRDPPQPPPLHFLGIPPDPNPPRQPPSSCAVDQSGRPSPELLRYSLPEILAAPVSSEARASPCSSTSPRRPVTGLAAGDHGKDRPRPAPLLPCLSLPPRASLCFSHLSSFLFTGTDAMDARALPRVHHRCRFASDPAGDRRISPPPPWTNHPQTSSVSPCLSRAPSVAPSPCPYRCVQAPAVPWPRLCIKQTNEAAAACFVSFWKGTLTHHVDRAMPAHGPAPLPASLSTEPGRSPWVSCPPAPAPVQPCSSFGPMHVFPLLHF